MWNIIPPVGQVIIITMRVQKEIFRLYHRVDRRLTEWMARRGIALLRWSVGLVFVWFGALKYFPGLSPADELARRTIQQITFGLLPEPLILPVLATWECLIGLGLVSGRFLRATLFLLGLQMLGTFTPALLFPREVFARFPFVLTLEGQYIVKNLVIISAGIVIGATVRGGQVIADPEAARIASEAEEEANEN